MNSLRSNGLSSGFSLPVYPFHDFRLVTVRGTLFEAVGSSTRTLFHHHIITRIDHDFSYLTDNLRNYIKSATLFLAVSPLNIKYLKINNATKLRIFFLIRKNRRNDLSSQHVDRCPGKRSF